MDSNTMRRLAQHLHDLRRRNRDNNRASEQPSFDTTVEDDSTWDQGRRSGDGRRSQDQSR